jgi:hypothetical protein
MLKSEWINLSQTDRIQERAATNFCLDSFNSTIDFEQYEVNARKLNRYVGYLSGVQSLDIEARPETFFDKKDAGTKASLYYPEEQQGLPSSYQRPRATLYVRQADEPSSSARKRSFEYELGTELAVGMLALYIKRFKERNSMPRSERTLGLTPFLASVAVEEFMDSAPWLTASVYAGGYALIAAGDYFDARRILGKDAQPPIWRQKRWSLKPCGAPVERTAEIVARSLWTLGNVLAKRQTFVRTVKSKQLYL